MNRYTTWGQHLSYPFAGQMINHYFGPFPAFTVFRSKHIGTKLYSDTMRDLIGCYCAGGEI